MRHFRYIVAAMLLCALGLVSCKKEIFLDYHSVGPIMVVEGSLCQDSAVVRLTTTVDMASPFSQMDSLSGVDVSILYDETCIPLIEKARGVYAPKEEFHGVPGKEYTLRIVRDGDEFVSRSYMNQPIVLLRHGFRLLDMIGTKVWMYSLTIQDTPGVDNWYVYYYYYHGKQIGWDVTFDSGNDGGLIPIDILIGMDEELEIDSDDFEYDPIEVGDELTVEVRSVDKKTYDYLYSLVVTMMSYSNAISDFSVKSDSEIPPVCLGYFSSYSSVVLKEVYQKEETLPDMDIPLWNWPF